MFSGGHILAMDMDTDATSFINIQLNAGGNGRNSSIKTGFQPGPQFHPGGSSQETKLPISGKLSSNGKYLKQEVFMGVGYSTDAESLALRMYLQRRAQYFRRKRAEAMTLEDKNKDNCNAQEASGSEASTSKSSILEGLLKSPQVSVISRNPFYVPPLIEGHREYSTEDEIVGNSLETISDEDFGVNPLELMEAIVDDDLEFQGVAEHLDMLEADEKDGEKGDDENKLEALTKHVQASLMTHVFRYLSLQEVAKCRLVCRSWRFYATGYLDTMLAPIPAFQMFPDIEVSGTKLAWIKCQLNFKSTEPVSNTIHLKETVEEVSKIVSDDKPLERFWPFLPLRCPIFEKYGRNLVRAVIALADFPWCSNTFQVNTVSTVLIECFNLEILEINEVGNIHYQNLDDLENKAFPKLKTLVVRDHRSHLWSSLGGDIYEEKFLTLIRAAYDLDTFYLDIIDSWLSCLIISINTRLAQRPSFAPILEVSNFLLPFRCRSRSSYFVSVRISYQLNLADMSTNFCEFPKDGTFSDFLNTFADALRKLYIGESSEAQRQSLGGHVTHLQFPLLPLLESLEISDCDRFKLGTMDFLIQMPSLKSLVLRTSPEPRRRSWGVGTGVEKLFNPNLFLAHTQMDHLNHLILDGDFKKKVSIERILICFPRIETMTISLGKFQAFEEFLLTSHRMSCLRSLSLSLSFCDPPYRLVNSLATFFLRNTGTPLREVTIKRLTPLPAGMTVNVHKLFAALPYSTICVMALLNFGSEEPIIISQEPFEIEEQLFPREEGPEIEMPQVYNDLPYAN